MNAPLTLASCTAMTVLLTAVAHERARTYGLSLRLLDWRSIVAFACAALASYAIPHPGWSAPVALAAGAVATATDLQTGYVFDRMLLVAAPFALVAAWADERAAAAVAAALVTAAAFAALFVITRRGIGLGDVKLASLLAVSLGVAGTLRATAAAFCAGALYGLVILIGGANRKREVPFAGFLALGTALALLEGSH